MRTVCFAINVLMFTSLLNSIKSEVSVLLECDSSSLDYWCPTFRDSMVVTSSKVEMYWILGDEITT
jgi:hypothetical protein